MSVPRWRPRTQPPKKPGSYIILCPSADPEKPHVSKAWYEPRGTKNRPGWQLLDIAVAAWGGPKAISHWMDWREGLPSRAAQLKVTRRPGMVRT